MMTLDEVMRWIKSWACRGPVSEQEVRAAIEAYVKEQVAAETARCKEIARAVHDEVVFGNPGVDLSQEELGRAGAAIRILKAIHAQEQQP